MNQAVKVVVGAPIHRAGAYILDKFLANQKEIQQRYSSSELVLATVEDDFADELDSTLSSIGIKGKVLRYTIPQPAPARPRAWNIAYGRETIRQYTLLQTGAEYMLTVDADMTYDPALIEIMEREIQHHHAAFSGYVTKMYSKWGGLALVAGGCCLLSRAALEKLKFRCIELSNGRFLFEDTLLEFDLMRTRCKIRKGFFLSISHYQTETVARHVEPHRVAMMRRIANSVIVRYILISSSLVARRNVPWELKVRVRAVLDAVSSLRLHQNRR